MKTNTKTQSWIVARAPIDRIFDADFCCTTPYGQWLRSNTTIQELLDYNALIEAEKVC